MTIAILAWLVAIPLLGAMTGLRTMTPVAVLCWFAWKGNLPVAGTWAFWTAKLVSAIVFTVLALGEFVGDKLPFTPNRTAAGPLVGRFSFGAMVGALCAIGLRGSWIEGAVLGAIGAVFGAFAGFHLRHWLVSKTGGRDLPVALLEDALAVGVSIFAAGIVTG